MRKRPEQETSRQGSIRSFASDHSTLPMRTDQHAKSSSLLSNFRKLSKSKNDEHLPNPLVISTPQPLTSNPKLSSRRTTDHFSENSRRQPSISSSFSNHSSQHSLQLNKSTTLSNSGYPVYDTSPSSPTQSRRSSQYTISTQEEFKTPNRKASNLTRIQTNASVVSASPSIMGLEINLERPKEDWQINIMFDELMTKRDFKSLPEAAKQQMKDYPIEKKWMLIYQDALSERKKVERTKKGGDSPATPETYVRLLMDKSITVRQLGNLWVSLRTEPVDWVREFIDAQGPIALSTVLQQLHTRSTSDLLNDEFLEKEISIIRCLRTVINSQRGANYALESRVCVPAITGALISTKLATRKLVTDMLSFLAHCQPPDGYEQVLKALNSISPDNIHYQAKTLDKRNSIISQPSKGLKRFEQWLRVVEQTMEGRGKLGSMVGASDEFKSNGTNGESQLMDYALSTMVLINSITDGGSDFKSRTHLRAQLKAGGVQRIFKKFHMLNNDLINEKIQEYEDAAAEDYDALLTSERIGEDVDLNDPVSLVKNIWGKIQHSDAENYFLSAIQHLFLNQSDNSRTPDSPEIVRSFRLIDGLISNITMGATTDDDAALNVAIHKLYDGLQTDEVARRAILDSREATKRAEEAVAERDELARQISLGSDGMITKLSNELKEQEIILMKQRKLNDNLANELEEVNRKRILEKHEQELEMREMLILLNNSSEASPNSANAELTTKLKGQLSKKKNQLKFESKRYGKPVEPNRRLRVLRDKMEDIEQQAKELEMTNFVEMKRTNTVNAVPVQVVDVKPRKVHIKKENKGADLDKLDELRKKLQSLQMESNDILKFDLESKQKELMNKKKLMALERLKELQSRFENLNIDFSVPSTATDNDGYRTLDPKLDEKMNEKLNDELDEIERLSEQIQGELEFKENELTDESSEQEVKVPSASFLESLEAKYIRGQKQTPKADFYERPSVVEKLKSSKGFQPAFLEELASSVGKKDAIADPQMTPASKKVDSNFSGPSTIALSDVPSSDKTQTSASVPGIDSSSFDVAKQEIKVEKVDDSRSSTVPTSTGPPPPPLPPILSASGPPPPPPPPFLSNGPAPPPPPPPPFGKNSPVPPPPPPFPVAKGRTPTISPLLPQSPSLFDGFPRPKKKLKQLHWEKVESTENSFWEAAAPDKVANELLASGIFDELESIFAAKEIKQLNSKAKGDSQRLTFLARDISQQFQINLHAFSTLSDEQLVNKIIKCDRSVLENSSVIEFLGKQELSEIPNGLARNLEPYRTYWAKGSEKSSEKDPNELQRADRIYLELFYNLQDYWPSRMRALKVITSYEKEYSDLVKKLRAIEEATEDIQNSKHLRNVFDIILAVGNYMNDSSKQALGFKLSTLQRLTFMKNDKNSITFLHYVEKIIRKSYPEAEQFIEEISKASDVAKISIEQLSTDSREFSKSVKNVESSIDIGNLSDSSKFHPLDKVLVKVLPVLPEAKRKSDLLSDQVKFTMSEFESLMRYFGEDPNDIFAKNSFFKKFVDFVSDYKKVNRENLAKEEEERAYQQRLKMYEPKSKAVAGEDGDNSEDNVMDSLLEKLKAAGPAKGKPSSARKRAQARKNLLKMKIDENDDEASDNEETEDDDIGSVTSSIEPSPSKSSKTLATSKSEEGDDDVGSRARNLLQELRSGANTPTPKENGMTRAQLLRQQQRLKRRQSDLGTAKEALLQETKSEETALEDIKSEETKSEGTKSTEEIKVEQNQNEPES